MFRFAHPEMLWLLLVVVAMVGLYVVMYFIQLRKLREFGNEELVASLMPNVSKVRPHVKFGLVALALAILALALAQPQMGTKKETIKTSGVEAMFVLDVSNSMRATDVAPTRLDNAKMLLSKLIDNMPDDKVGLIIFAGDAFMQMPITADNVSAKMFMNTISPGSVPVPGTAIGKAMELAIRSFGEPTTDVGRTIIVLTDGENHEDDAVEAAEEARANGITVNVVGFGSPKGAPIPVPGSNDHWRDAQGNVVVTRLNEEMCKQVAKAGDGIYVRAGNSNTALRALNGQIEKMQKGDVESSSFSSYDEKFYILAWIALVLLIGEFFVLNRKNKTLNKIKWF